MAKLTLEQIDSLIDDDKLTEEQLSEHLKEGYTTEDIKAFFTERIRSMKEDDEENEDDDGFN